jgi:hypothetical protein
MFERSTTLWLALSLGVAGFVFALTGCSENKLNNTPVADMAQPPDLTVVPDLSLPGRDPSDHPELPQVTNYGGPVLAAPEVWTVVWPGDEDLGARINKFTGWMLQSDFWINSMGEYGVGAGKAKGVIVLPSAAPATIDDKDLKPLVKSVVAMLGEPTNSNSLIQFVVPEAVKQTMQGGQGCNDYGGYHSQTRSTTGGSMSIPYAVNLQCHEGTKTLFDLLTEVVTHEVAEASSDPLPFNQPGWTNDTVLLGGEIGDLCVELTTTFTATFPGDVDAGVAASTEKYVVQRLYSQKAAAAGKTDPCVPAPMTPYFNVALDPTDAVVKTDPSSGSGDTMVKVEPYSMGDVGDIQWTVYGADMVSGLKIDPSSGTARAGETIRMNIHADKAAKGQQVPLVVEAKTSDGTINEWFGSITVN